MASANSTSAASSPLVTVRLDATVRGQFDRLATSSDRTLAQLLRYAVSAYLEQTPASSTISGDVPAESRHTSIRLSQDLHTRAQARAMLAGVTVSDVLRAAAAWWMTTANQVNLGTPTQGAGVDNE